MIPTPFTGKGSHRKKRQKLEARLGPDTFVAAWGTPIRGEAPHGDENDVAVAVAARGAWTRFWVRGARYLRRCIGVAGFYLDGIAAAPATVAAFRREGGRLDMHAANKTAVYLELYPYLDSVWTGEASYLLGDANHYLVGIAGLPWGRPSQLLAGALRKEPWLYYRALLFGMTERAGWSDTDVSLPRLGALWRTFDAVDVASADVVGFWRREDARAVMTTACGDVKRTAFVVDGGAMVVVAEPRPGEAGAVFQIAAEAVRRPPMRAFSLRRMFSSSRMLSARSMSALPPCLVLRTSGTTGQPKLVYKTQQQLSRGGAIIAKTLALEPSDCFLLCGNK